MPETVRRNGQMAACEPCRKNKYRCDHGRPMCARCVRRGFSSDQCYYHPAPMSTQRKSVPRQQPLTPATTQASIPATPASMSVSSPACDTFERATGFVGLQPSLIGFADDGAMSTQRTYESSCAMVTRTGVAAPSPPVKATSSQISDGVGILELLLDWDIDLESLAGRFLSDYHFYVLGPIIPPILHAVVRALQPLKADRSHTNLLDCSKRIFEETARPLQFPISPADGALAAAWFPDTVRWEAVGLCFTTLGMFLIGDSELIDYERKQRNAMTYQAWESAILCETFCQRFGLNDMTLWLQLSLHGLSAWTFGDNSYPAFRAMATLASTVFALDLHRGVNDDPTAPQYLLELRRRTLSLANENDKSTATFAGRPPFLSHMYFSTVLPLDVPNAALLATPAELEESKSRLDENGWNRHGEINPAARTRVLALLCPIREEALLLSNGAMVSDLEAKANRLLTQLRDAWQSLPPQLRIEVAPPDHVMTPTTSPLVFFRLEYCYTEFILFKRLVGCHEKYRHEVVRTSHELVNLVISMLKKRATIFLHRNDLEWAMVHYTMPASLILLSELFRGARGPQSDVVLSRSALVKDISAVVICCEWLIEIGQGNYNMIKQAQLIFSTGLDRVLDGNVGSMAEQSTTAASAAEPADALLTQDLEWNSWLESFGFDADAWLDMALQQPIDFPMAEG